MAEHVTGRLFLSYRREDTKHIAGRLADRLIDDFGPDRVFIDVDSIALGSTSDKPSLKP
jgi:hypothetical protein